MTYIPAALRRLVRDRAGGACEYCGLPEALSFSAHDVDHVVSLKHGGWTEEDNLALSCTTCNQHKGTDIASFDATTRSIVPLYNPRQDRWSDHFEVVEHRIEGRTPEGRATSRLLQWNRLDRISERAALSRAGLLRVPRGA
ncbi:MAG: HNH endonuclease [Polyangiaceae bacterium]